MSTYALFKAARIITAVIIRNACTYVHALALAVYAVFIRAAMVVAGSAVVFVVHQVYALGPAPGRSFGAVGVVGAGGHQDKERSCNPDTY